MESHHDELRYYGHITYYQKDVRVQEINDDGVLEVVGVSTLLFYF